MTQSPWAKSMAEIRSILAISKAMSELSLSKKGPNFSLLGLFLKNSSLFLFNLVLFPVY